MAKNEPGKASFASAGLILFNATSSYELVATGHALDPIRKRRDDLGTWKAALREAFVDAFNIDYEAVFFYAIRVLDILPPNPTVEQMLENIYKTSEYIVSRAGLLKHDLAGRIYHSALGRELAKAFATYYTGIPASELLAWIAVEKWDDKVADFACGSGTLLLAAYHKKLSIAFLDPHNKDATADDLHRGFVEDDLLGLDAMPFATHLTLVNLALQQPSAIFNKSRIYHVPVGLGKRLGSLDLLKGNCIWVQRRISGEDIGALHKTMALSKKRGKIELSENLFNIAIMNPPFTKKQRVSRVLDKDEFKKMLKKIGPEFTSLGGLPLPFVLLGDKYLAPDGRLALVVPSSVLDRSTWKGIRTLLTEKYELEHIIISWIDGKPSFSEDTELREILLIARKKSRDCRKKDFTLITHIDKDFSFIEARQMADQLSKSLQDPVGIALKSSKYQPIHCGQKLIGESISFPRLLIERTADNWYRLLAFRNPKLVRTSLLQQGLITDTTPPYDFDLSPFQITASKVGEVGLFIKQVGSAGFEYFETKPASGGIKSLMTSDYGYLSLKDASCRWLVSDPSLKTKEKFTPGTGHLLLPRKTDLYSTAKVVSVVSKDPVASNMWIPFEPSPQITRDGRKLALDETSKIIGLWLQSSFGVLALMSTRHEIRGAWSEWVTGDVRHMSILNIKKIDSLAADKLLDLWTRVKDVEWESLYNQLSHAIDDNTHPRRAIDETISNILLPDSVPDLDAFYKDLSNEIKKLGNLMK